MLRAVEFYAGIGGLHLSLQRSSADVQVVQAYDWNPVACQVYRHNHSTDPTIKMADISELSAEDLAAHNADIWVLSPACQPYTVLNPNAKGAADPRAKSFLHLIQNVLPKLAKMNALPSRLLVENVAGFESSVTRRTLVSVIRSLGYNTLELLLTPLQFEVPNSRLRYYFLAKKKPLEFAHIDGQNPDRIWRHIPGEGQDWVDDRFAELADSQPNTNIPTLSHYLDKLPAGNYSIPDKVLYKWGKLFDIVLPSSRRSCCFTRGYTQLVNGSGSILQENEELDTTFVFNDLAAAAPSQGIESVRILDPLRLRFFSPNELLRMFGFNPPIDSLEPSNFQWPKEIALRSAYKLIGNSVNVTVVQALVEYLLND